MEGMKVYFSFFWYGFFCCCFFFTAVASVFFCFAGCVQQCILLNVCVCKRERESDGENHINKIDFLNYFKEELHESYDAVLFRF